MPMSGNTYVAPTWVNGGEPTIDAAELQAMCDTIVQNQGDAAALETALQALTTTVDGKAQVVTGSYVGTGTYGQSNPNTLTFEFEPNIVLIGEPVYEWQRLGSFLLLMKDSYYSPVFINLTPSNNGSVYGVVTEFSEKSVSWYANSSKGQLNDSGIQYSYIAI